MVQIKTVHICLPKSVYVDQQEFTKSLNQRGKYILFLEGKLYIIQLVAVYKHCDIYNVFLNGLRELFYFDHVISKKGAKK